jgi:hypothetical protein
MPPVFIMMPSPLTFTTQGDGSREKSPLKNFLTNRTSEIQAETNNAMEKVGYQVKIDTPP